MRFRKLRIAWSVVFGIVCLLVIVLWIRSYSWRDPKVIDVSPGRWIHIISIHGRASFAYINDSPLKPLNSAADHVLGRFLFTEVDKSERTPIEFRLPVLHSLAFEWNVFDDGVRIIIPYWSLVFVSMLLACAPWTATFKLHFSLRTSLIVMTLVAVALAAVVMAARM